MAGQLRVDEITDEAGTGAPSFPNGIPPASLGTGTPSSANFLRGDGEWAQPSSETTINTLDPMLKTMLIYGTLLNEPKWYLSSTTVDLAPNVTHMIMVVGSGGSGGVLRVSGNEAFGGNGGGVAIKFVTPSSTLGLTLTIGAGGSRVTRTTNGASPGNDGATTTVTGTGININVPGGKGGQLITSSWTRNPANDLPTGGDLIFTGGRALATGRTGCTGSSIFDRGGYTLVSGAGADLNSPTVYTGGGATFFDAGASPYFGISSQLNVSDTNTQNLIVGQLSDKERFAGSSVFGGRFYSAKLSNDYASTAINPTLLGLSLYQSNILSLLFPYGFGGFSNSVDYQASRTGAFIGGTSVYSDTTSFSPSAQAGGIGAGGGACAAYAAATSTSGAGGPGAVVIWSFVNG